MSEDTNKPIEAGGDMPQQAGEPAGAAKSPAEPAEPKAPAAAEPAGAAKPEAAPGAAGSGDAGETKPAPADRAARDAARAERLAARAAAKAAGADGAAGGADGAAAAEAPPKEPSPNQPKLDRLVAILKEQIGGDAVEDAYINEMDRHTPTVVVNRERWHDAAVLLRDHPELKLHYLRSLSGVDYETHMEVVYHLFNLQNKQTYCFKVRTDREQAEVPSVADVWPAANWNEREAWDLLGIRFTGHPNLKRIMLPDDWVGHPLRKDYVPVDPEV
jgi:NADH-quinone oxidoreductase subunit C